VASSLALPRIMRVGSGAFAETGSVVRSLGLSKPLIVTDPFLEGQGTAARLQAVLRDAGLEARVFSAVVPDPTTSSVEAALAFLKAGDHDCVIGLGGGSPIDTAKAVAVLAVVGGEMRALKSPHQQDDPGLPIVAIPTTAGTGSEATRFTIVTEESSSEKMLCIGLAYLPIAAIVDYELTMSMPKRLTADTGVDALTHAIEAYVSRRANAFTDDLSLIAMRSIWKNIRKAYADPADRPAREAMMLGATQAGIAFSNSSVALVHGMSRPIGAFFHIAHGLSNAMLLPTATAYSAEAAAERYADCARAVGIAQPGASSDAAAHRLVEALYGLNADLEVPSPKRLSIDERRWNEAKETMAQQALDSGSPGNNPRVPSAAEIVRLYDAVWTATRVRL
jgi:alcohol dehydrogenase class IV